MTSRGIRVATASVVPMTTKRLLEHRPRPDERHRRVHAALRVDGVGLHGLCTHGRGILVGALDDVTVTPFLR
jgi:hypothetical protein